MAIVAHGNACPAQPGAPPGFWITVRAAAPREPVPAVISPMSSLKAITLTAPRPRASRGTTYWRTMQSIFVRKAA